MGHAGPAWRRLAGPPMEASQTAEARAEMTCRGDQAVLDARRENDRNGKFGGRAGTELVVLQASSDRSGSLTTPSASGGDSANTVDMRLLF